MTQTAFRAALLDPTAPVPSGLLDPMGRPAGKRFNVYRNNVAASLIEALEIGFPVLRKLLGEAAFKTLAGRFLRAHPPASPRLAFYGAEMPGFLARLPALASLPYLPDVARLELALRTSYHAADAAPLDVTRLSPEAVIALCPCPAPATHHLSSPYPILAIWLRNTLPDAPKPAPGAQSVIITRPAFDPVPHLFPVGGAALLKALDGATPLSAALETVMEVIPDADIPTLLTLLLTSGALTLPKKATP